MDPGDARRILDEELARGRERIAAAETLEALEDAKVAAVGRKSPLNEVQRSLGSFDVDAKRELGRRTNEVFAALREAIEARRTELEVGTDAMLLESDAVDVTLPGRRSAGGSLHPLTLVEDEIVDIFTRMGYRVVEGAEVEDQWHNFDALNIPPDHPARTSMDTTFLDVPGHPELVLRTHTSPMQIRTMETQEPPVYVIVPGRVFRNEEITAKNMPVFHQVEGLAVDEGITVGDLMGTLDYLMKALFGETRESRFVTHHFPFTEPSIEALVSCHLCDGSGCTVCRHSGWIEVGGSGMVDPNLFEFVGYDPERYTGFAFGWGLERIAVLRHGIPDLRELWRNDPRLLGQF
jgi:phenylalanyl-tRNA synthetase alpha chain